MMGMPELKSNKQESFAKAIALEGMNQTEAYKIAYPTSLKWASKTVHNNAYKLMQNPDITLRIQELKASKTKKLINKIAKERVNKIRFAKSPEDMLRELKALVNLTKDIRNKREQRVIELQRGSTITIKIIED